MNPSFFLFHPLRCFQLPRYWCSTTTSGLSAGRLSMPMGCAPKLTRGRIRTFQIVSFCTMPHGAISTAQQPAPQGGIFALPYVSCLDANTAGEMT